jgi:hypothetical protein
MSNNCNGDTYLLIGLLQLQDGHSYVFRKVGTQGEEACFNLPNHVNVVVTGSWCKRSGMVCCRSRQDAIARLHSDQVRTPFRAFTTVVSILDTVKHAIQPSKPEEGTIMVPELHPNAHVAMFGEEGKKSCGSCGERKMEATGVFEAHPLPFRVRYIRYKYCPGRRRVN